MKSPNLKPWIVFCVLTTAAHTLPAVGEDADKTSDIWSKAAITTTYTLSRHLNPFDIDVEVHNGIATLRGTVESDVEKDLAEQLALGVDGIKKVENELTISPDAPERTDSDAFMNKVTDANITAKVKSQLLWNRNTHGVKIGVDTKGAIVTLTGNVESDVEAELAEQIARNTSDVLDVENRIVVADPSVKRADRTVNALDEAEVEIADSWITTKIKSALLYNRNIELGEINVTTSQGIVHLSGDVGSDDERQAAIDIVRGIRGVKDVKADLTVAAHSGNQ